MNVLIKTINVLNNYNVKEKKRVYYKKIKWYYNYHGYYFKIKKRVSCFFVCYKIGIDDKKFFTILSLI